MADNGSSVARAARQPQRRRGLATLQIEIGVLIGRLGIAWLRFQRPIKLCRCLAGKLRRTQTHTRIGPRHPRCAVERIHCGFRQQLYAGIHFSVPTEIHGEVVHLLRIARSKTCRSVEFRLGSRVIAKSGVEQRQRPMHLSASWILLAGTLKFVFGEHKTIGAIVGHAQVQIRLSGPTPVDSIRLGNRACADGEQHLKSEAKAQ